MRFNHNIIAVVVQILVGVEVVSAKYAISGLTTGINAATGERPARRDITELKNDVPAFSLYILSLQAMMDIPESNITSWFQVSGIHGRPYTSWDGVGRTSGAPLTGYCTHSDALFMSWHRPYLALYEQILAQQAQIIAKQFNSATYQQAADRFRIPYWDWAAPPYQMPDWFSTSTILINTPTGQRSVTNPLAAYRFRNYPYPSSTFPSGNALSRYSYTVRRPSNRQSNPSQINSLLASQAPGQAQQLYTVFTRATTWNQMATQSSNGPSFEGPHGWLHITVGGNGGHMTDVGYAGFDPIFLLHHTNVDRLGTMWQAIYPDQYMTPATEGGGTYTLVAGQRIDAQTNLLPFHQSNGATPRTSDAARCSRAFGYSYPDVKDWLYSTNDLRSQVTARVNTLYNLRGTRTTRKRSPQGLRKGPGRPNNSPPPLLSPSKPPREWIIDMTAPNAALRGDSYSVLLFLNSKPADPSAWFAQSIGAMFVLAQPMTDASGAPSTGAALPARNEVVITQYLQDRGVDTRDVPATKKFIDNNLVWGVQRADGSIVPNEQFKGLKLLVEDDLVKEPEKITELPKYSDKTEHPDVTPVTPVNPA